MKLVLKCTALMLATLLAGCSTESQNDNGNTPIGGESDSGERREVMLTLKNKLVLKNAGTKADTPIATAEENKIETLDVYVFASATEDGTYTYQERFAYRSDGSDLPNGATELELTPGKDETQTTGLLNLKKGLFVKLYCIANQTELVNPTDETKPVADNAFQPITFKKSDKGDVEIATVGLPDETTFLSYHTPLLDAASDKDILITPLAMSGSYTTPLDLTDFENSARMQVGFKLTRLAARFDVVNHADKSRFTIQSISLANGRRGTSFFPIKVYGQEPTALEGELITYPARAFEGDNANKGTQTGAFYTYPSPTKDNGYIILKGTYQVNKTESKGVTYQVPFKQQTADGSSSFLEINNNHRYTIGITEADDYHLDFTLTVDDWTDDGKINEYNPEDNGATEINLDIPHEFDGKTTFDKEKKTITMAVDANSNFDLKLSAQSPIALQKTYQGGLEAQQFDWLTIDEPVQKSTKSAISEYSYHISLTENYTKGYYPRAILRFTNSIDGSENVIFIETSFETPELTSSETITMSVEADKTQIPETTITGTCIGGCVIKNLPEWITLENIAEYNSDPTTSGNNFSYKLKLALTENNKNIFPQSLPEPINVKIVNKQDLDKAATVNISFTETASAEDITNFDEKNSPTTYRVNTSGKTLSVNAYSMFKVPELSSAYNLTYCDDINNGKAWITPLPQTVNTEIVNNRRKYTYNITIKESSGKDANYQFHQGTITLKYNDNTIKEYTICRGASFAAYPVDVTKGSGSKYYSGIKKGKNYWAPVNLGAYIIPANNSDTNGRGLFYQWGRKVGHTLPINAKTAGPVKTDNTTNFITGQSDLPYDWITPQNGTLWLENKTSNDPCPNGWKVPSQANCIELGLGIFNSQNFLITVSGENGINIILPLMGQVGRAGDNSYADERCGYYTTTTSGTQSLGFNYFTKGGEVNFLNHDRAGALPIRCIKE